MTTPESPGEMESRLLAIANAADSEYRCLAGVKPEELRHVLSELARLRAIEKRARAAVAAFRERSTAAYSFECAMNDLDDTLTAKGRDDD